VSDWFVALALVFVIEGFLPFVAPGAWRETMRRLSELSDGQLRFMGLGSMVAGLLLLVVMR
jgi:uncharacterized protein YjeT (DUF2065 family)